MSIVGNFFTEAGITDPEGDGLRVTAIVGTTGYDSSVPFTGTNLDPVPETRTGTTTPPFGESGSGARIRMYSNGDFEFLEGNLATRHGDFLIGVDVKYSDGKSSDHSASNAVDGVKRLNVSVTGGLPANEAPIDPNPEEPVVVSVDLTA